MLAAGAGCTDAEPTGTMFLALADEAPTQVHEVGVDAESYAEIVARLGYVPVGLAALEPRVGASARVRVELAPDAPTAMFDATFTMVNGGAAPTNLALLLGSNGGTTTAMLLPAVQKVRELGAARGTDGGAHVFLDLEGAAAISELTAPLPEPQPAGDSFFDITFAVDATPAATAAERALIATAQGPYAVDRVALGAASATGEVPIEQVAFEGASPALTQVAASGVALSGTVDVRSPSGDRVFRFRARDAQVTVAGTTGEATASDGAVITYTGLEFASTDTARQVALFQSSYQTYGSQAATDAGRDLMLLRAALDGSAAAALGQWLDGTGGSSKTVITARLVAAVVDASIGENLACTMATPGTIKAGKDPAINGGLNRDIIRRLHGQIAEAAYLAPPPSRLTVRFNKLLVSSLGTTPTSEGNTMSQCEALIALAQRMDEVAPTSLTATEGRELKIMGDLLAIHRAAYLDRVVADFVAHMNSVASTDAGLDGTWRTAAKTKADILIESLGAAGEGGSALQLASKHLLGQ